MWTVQTNLSIYVQQAMESKPCPHCGACTLSCEDAAKLATAAPVYWHSSSRVSMNG
jgi:heterodisulfide reductase subunit C